MLQVINYTKSSEQKFIDTIKLKENNLHDINGLYYQLLSFKYYSSSNMTPICSMCQIKERRTTYLSNKNTKKSLRSNKVQPSSSNNNLRHFLNVAIFIFASIYCAVIFLTSISMPYNYIFTGIALCPLFMKCYLWYRKHND